MSTTPTANDRFKQSSRSSFWIALIVATVFHAAVFMGSPVFALGPGHDDDIAIQTLLDLPPDVRVPEPPAPMRRPAKPVIADVQVEDHRTIEPTIPQDWIRRLEPPQAGGREDARARELTPMDIAPRLLNARAVQRALQDHYPAILRDAKIGGTTSVRFLIDETGRIEETRIHESSGYEAFDQAALRVARIMEFSPALNRDQRIAVWVAIEIRFEVR